MKKCPKCGSDHLVCLQRATTIQVLPILGWDGPTPVLSEPTQETVSWKHHLIYYCNHCLNEWQLHELKE